MRLLNSIVRILIGLFFIASALSKLFPIEPFEAAIVNTNLTNWFFVPFISRTIIGLELFLGFCILFNIWLKNLIFFATQTLLIVFTIYLVFLLYFDGNETDCGCFGNWFSLSTSASILKNVLLITLLFIVKENYHSWTSKYLTIIILFLSFSVPFLLNKVGLQNIQATEINKKIDWSGLPTTYPENKQIDLDNGNNILVFFSASCSHCKSAAYKFATLNKKKNIENITIVIATSKQETLKNFISETALNYPIIWMKDDAFFNYSGGTLPAIYYIEKGVLKKRWTGKYFNIEELSFFINYK